jgi:NADPH2:quinone reductase
MSKAIRMTRTGGPDVMEYVEVDVPPPGPGEARVRQVACGLNFIDVYFRTGLYPQPLPAGLGQEGAGVVEAVGAGVQTVRPGDRVAYAGRPNGAYAQVRNVPAAILLRLPESIDFDTAAAMLLQGLTAEYLLHRTYAVQPGDTILFHAAAGGVGLIACQWAKRLGATVIGTVSTDAKAELARAHGCDYPIVTARENVVERVAQITGGRKLPVVYDSIGKDTFAASLDCLRPLGLMVCFGNSSGPVPPVDIQVLSAKGSLFLTRPTLGTFAADRTLLETMAANLFAVVADGGVRINIGQRYPLAEVARAHADLEARRTTGSTLLIP